MTHVAEARGASQQTELLMIARQWRGFTREEDVEEYLQYLNRTGLEAYAATPGNRGFQVLCRRHEERAEFLIISLWDSMEAVERFAGPQFDRAVFYPEDDRFLVARDLEVAHYEVLQNSNPPTS